MEIDQNGRPFMAFTLACVPTGQMRPRFTGRTAYKHETQKGREAELGALLAPYRPDKPIIGPVTLLFTAYMPVPKALPAYRRDILLAGAAHAGKPDLDNLAKQLKDALTRAGFWHDDRQVAALACKKIFGAPARWEVGIYPWEEA